MRECDVRHIVFSSSCAVYGVPAIVPIPETSPLNPVNPYGATKMMCERILSDCADAFSMNWIALRYFNAAGADPDGEIGECHVPETHVIPLLLDAWAGEREAFTVFGTDYRLLTAHVSLTKYMSLAAVVPVLSPTRIL